MASPIVLGVAGLVIFLVVRYLNSSDIPKIKNLPEIPGVPLFGNLLQLGTDHATVAQKWAKQYGPVFQTRLGNKVRGLNMKHIARSMLRIASAHRLRQHIRVRQAPVDHQSVCINLSTNLAHLPHCGLVIQWIYHRYLAMGSQLQRAKKGSSNSSQSSSSAELHALD
jgi:hypothetical protein